jgi:hypothetical protein
MVNFTAKEKGEPKPGGVTPERAREPLDKFSDGTAVNHYYFRSKTDTVATVTAPGFFNFMRETFSSGIKKGIVHFVTCHLGEVSDGLTQVDLHVVDVPTQFSGPVLMAAGSVNHFEPVKADKTKAA